MSRAAGANGRGAARPRDRAATLLGIAEELFGRHGYHGVSVQDVAAAAGISGPALYRHYASKQELFTRVLDDGLSAMQQVTDEALAAHPLAGRRRLAAVTEALAVLAVQRREAAALWRWNADELRPGDRATIVRRGRELVTSWATVLRDDRADVTDDGAQLLCLGALAVFGSVAVHRAAPPKGRFVALLADTAGAVLMSPVPAQPDAAAPVPDAAAAQERRERGRREQGRREQILTAAARLFARHGYRAVSMGDIGSAVGLAAPSVYRHFSGKDRILFTAAHRMADRLMLDSTRALAGADGPAGALAALLESYVDTLWEFSDLALVYSREVRALPRAQRADLVRVQRDYVAQWVSLLREIDPERGEADAKVLAHAGLTVVNDLARSGWARARPARRAESIALGRAALGLPQQLPVGAPGR